MCICFHNTWRSVATLSSVFVTCRAQGISKDHETGMSSKLQAAVQCRRLYNLGDLLNQLRTQSQLRGQAHGPAARGRPRRCEKRTPKPTGRRRGLPGLWVLLRFRLTLAGRALQVHALFSELILRLELVWEISQILGCGASLLRSNVFRALGRWVRSGL